MNLFTSSPASTLETLTEKYRPRTIAEFVGLDKPKRIAAKLVANPMASSWLFVGEPGTGKTTLALAIAAQMPAELHHVPSQDCNVDTLRSVIARLHYVPREGCRMHVVLADEADQMTRAAQLYLLSKLDSTSFPPNTIFIFTCNATDGLEPRFLSRCGRVDFSSYGNAKDAATLLELVWDCEAPQGAERPNFARVVKESTGNLRTALMTLQSDLLLA